MNTDRALYSVVQYCPDPARAEVANVGVVLFRATPAFFETRISTSLDRVQKFFRPGKAELRRIAREIEAVQYRLARVQPGSEAQFQQFVDSRADRVRLSQPRLVKLEDPRRELERLYTDLVGSPSTSQARISGPYRLSPSVGEIFGRMEAAGRLSRPGHVSVPIVGSRLEVPFSFRNGVENLVRPESFERNARGERHLEQLGFAGKLIHDHPPGTVGRRLVVLSTGDDPDPVREQRAAAVLREFRVKFVPAIEAESFAREAERDAH